MKEMMDQSIVVELRRRIRRKGPGKPVPRIVCADGFEVSAQAGRYLYCSPREDEAEWTHIELGYPSAAIPNLAAYIESNDPQETATVWGNVPIGLVADLIAAHGGFATVQPQRDKEIGR